jgi:hypothetical protein
MPRLLLSVNDARIAAQVSAVDLCESTAPLCRAANPVPQPVPRSNRLSPLPDLFCIDDSDQNSVAPGNGGQVVVISDTFRRRQDIAPVHVDNAVHAINKKSLHVLIAFRDNHKISLGDDDPETASDRAPIHDRDDSTAYAGDPPHHGVGLLQLCERRALDDLLHLEDIDPERLFAVQAQKQQRQPVAAG